MAPFFFVDAICTVCYNGSARVLRHALLEEEMITKRNEKRKTTIELFAAKSEKGYDICCTEYNNSEDVIEDIHISGLTAHDIKEIIYSLQLLLKHEIETTHIPTHMLGGM